jgi:hypothetical protein
LAKSLKYFLIICINAVNVYSQHPVFKNFTTKNGLPSNEAHFVFQDSKGYIWICTDAGLAKYNANYFKIFDTSNGLPDNTIFEVKEDSQGHIWFRSFSGHLGYISNDSVFLIEANTEVRKFIGSGIVSSFYIAKDGALFIGKQNTELNSFLKISPPYKAKNAAKIWQEASKESLDLIVFDSGDVIFSDHRHNPQSAKTNNYYLKVYDQEHRLLFFDNLDPFKTSPQIHKYVNNGILFLSINKSILKIDLAKRKIEKKIKEFAVMSIRHLNTNILLVGTVKGGVMYYKADLDTFYYRILDGTTNTCILKDDEDGMWFSTLEKGVFYLPDENIKKHVITEESGEYISYLTSVKEGELMVGFNNGNLYKANLKSNSELDIKKIFHDSKGNLGRISASLRVGKRIIICGNKGNIIYSESKGKHVSEIRSDEGYILPFRKIAKYNDKIYMASMNDLFVTDTTLKGIKLEAGITDRILSLAVDTANSFFYIGTLRGLYRYTKGEVISDRNKLNDLRVEDVKVKNGRVLAATKANGILVIQGNLVDTINTTKGLMSNFCKTILPEKNAIWVTTNNGLSKVTYTSKNNFVVDNYPIEYFIEPYSIDGICFSRDFMFFYSGSSIYSFSEKAGKTKDRFYVKGLFYNGRKLDKHNPVLSYNFENLMVSYEALFYKRNEKILYRYKIAKEWIYTNETSINFSLLSPGNYIVYIEALNHNRQWIKSRPVQFTIDKAFWMKSWFIFSGALLVSALTALVLYKNHKQVLIKAHEKNLEQSKLYALEIKAMRSLMNPHFIFNSLNSIQQFIMLNQNQEAERYLSKFSKLLRKILESNVNESLTIAEEIELLNGYIEMEQRRFDRKLNAIIEVDEKLDIIKLKIPHLMVQPFVENAIWHGLLPKKGERNLLVKFEHFDDHVLRCVIEDDGVGRQMGKEKKETPEKKSLSLSFIKQRLELYRKTLSINCGVEIIDKTNINGESEGTRIIAILPLVN